MTSHKQPPSPDPASLAPKILEAEARLDFFQSFLRLTESSQGFIHLHDALAEQSLSTPGPEGDHRLFQAVRELERSQVWRMVCALWENIGDRLGDEYGGVESDQLSDGATSHRLFFGYSLPLEYWTDPRSDGYPEGYYRDTGGEPVESQRLLHKRALAYGHAAEEAASNQRYALATLLRRKAGLAWATSVWGDRADERADDTWTRTQLLEVSGAKWREAARAYFRACLFQGRASSDDEKGVTFERRYAPDDQDRVDHDRWPKQPPNRRELDRFFGENDDIERLRECWKRWATTRKDAYAGMNDQRIRRFARWNVERRANEGLCNNLGVLEDAFRAAGRVREARGLFAGKRKADLRSWQASVRARLAGAWVPCNPAGWPFDDVERVKTRWGRLVPAATAPVSWLLLQFARGYHFATGTGRSVRRTLLCVVGLFGVVFPLIFARFAQLKYCSAQVCGGQVIHKLWESARFSLGQALTVPPGDIAPSSTLGRWLAVVETLFAAFSLGYTVWVITRNSYGG